MNFAQAGVPFIRCLEPPKHRHGLSALAAFPWKQLRQVLAGCRGELGDALGAGAPAQGRAVMARNGSKLHSKPSGESRSCSCAVLQQKNGDEAVKPQVIPQFAQLAGCWGGMAGSQAYMRLSKTVSGLCVSHRLRLWPRSWEATCQPAWEVWGH